MPIPAGLQPSRTGSAPNISYPDSTNSSLFQLAGGATTYFGLRFSGEQTGVEPWCVSRPFVPHRDADAAAPSVSALCLATLAKPH